MAESLSRSVMGFSCPAASPNRTPCELAKRWISSTSWEFRRPCSTSMAPMARPRSGGWICGLTGRSATLFICICVLCSQKLDYRRLEAPRCCLRDAHITRAHSHHLELSEQRHTEQVDDVLVFAHASITHFGGQGGADSEHTTQEDRDNQIDHELGARRRTWRRGGAQLNDVGLLRQALQIALCQGLRNLVQIALGRCYVALVHGRLIMLILQFQDALLLSLQRLAHTIFAAQIGLCRTAQRGSDVRALLSYARSQVADLALYGLVIRMILAQPGSDVGLLWLWLGQGRLQRLYDRALQHLRKRRYVASDLVLARLALLAHPLDGHQFRRQFGQAGIFDIQFLIGGDDAVLALIIRKLPLFILQIRAQCTGALVKPARILLRRLNLQLDIGFNGGLRKAIRERSRRHA